MTLVKICGITRLEDALAAIDAGAAALGFNFYTKSPRYISVRQAAKIFDRLPPWIIRIGVVVNFGTAREIRRLIEVLGLDGIQLHGDESADVARRLRPWPVIKAFRVEPKFQLRDLKGFPAAAVLLDGFSTGKFGGTGRNFDWNVARIASRFHRIIVSGGLTAENVADAIRTARPYGVDVASGVEKEPGKKDWVKLRKFMKAVQITDRGLSGR